MRKLIYLANAYSSKLKDRDLARAQEAQRRILESSVAGRIRKKYNVAVIPPIAISASMADLCEFGTGFAEWEGDDLLFISKCDELWVLVADGVQESIGVQAEIAYALATGKPVLYLDPKTLELELYENRIKG